MSCQERSVDVFERCDLNSTSPKKSLPRAPVCTEIMLEVLSVASETLASQRSRSWRARSVSRLPKCSHRSALSLAVGPDRRCPLNGESPACGAR